MEDTCWGLTISAAALHGFIMPAVEYTHLKARTPITFELVMQVQFLTHLKDRIPITFEVVMQVQFLVSMFATLFCTVPMLINQHFQEITKEAAEYDLGETKYYTILVLAAIAMQFLIIGSLGVIFSSTSLLGGPVSSLLVPVQQVFAVIFLREQFNAEKGMALAMCLWGFASYFYGEYKLSSKNKQAAKKEETNHEVV
ncbi:hypothetical protein K2173_007911 [Erythroxylum novogranatense]|uniref:Uncharacterized protein n=1 Tax=Erythroxylum novogranatense TaxID=1862640 RepID=A0AAV8T6S2_9ROSI|nr:hypothetical protein K2173_007911 [Erythroxylum novogranatense]